MGNLVRATTENGVATVLLNRPETFNDFNMELAGDLADRLEKAIRTHIKHRIPHV